MAEEAVKGGMQMLYGVLIRDALQRKDGDLGDLVDLSRQARLMLLLQPDLARAVEELEAEIARRSGRKGVPGSEKFVVETVGLTLTPEVRERIQQRFREAALEELARLDTGGDLTATPLSEVKGFPGGHGGTVGFFIREA